MNIIILGPPGSGKGTQSRNIASLNENVEVVDCGRLLRSSNIPDDARKLMDGGALISDEIVISVVRKKISDLITKSRGFIMDGFPRSIKQCSALFEIVDELEIRISCVIRLQLSEDLTFSRISHRNICIDCGDLFDSERGKCYRCGCNRYIKRKDDTNINLIRKRLGEYYSAEHEIMGFFERYKVLIFTVDASESVDNVAKDIRHQLLLFS